MALRIITPSVPFYTPPEYAADDEYWKSYGKPMFGAETEAKFYESRPGAPYTVDDSFPEIETTPARPASKKGPSGAAQVGGWVGNAAAIQTANNMMKTNPNLPIGDRLQKAAEMTYDDATSFFAKKPEPITSPIIKRASTSPASGTNPVSRTNFNTPAEWDSFELSDDFMQPAPAGGWEQPPFQGANLGSPAGTSPPTQTTPVGTSVNVNQSGYESGAGFGAHLQNNWGSGALVGGVSFGMSLLQGEKPGPAAKNAAYSTAGYMAGSYFGPVGGFVGGALGGIAGNAIEDVVGTVICTELYRLGHMPKHIWMADQTFGSLCDVNLVRGYQWWAVPAVRWMRRSKFAVWLAVNIAMPWAYHMAYCMGVESKDNLLGRAVSYVGTPVCRTIGFFLNKGTQYVNE